MFEAIFKPGRLFPRRSRVKVVQTHVETYRKHKETARKIVLERIAVLAPVCGVVPKRVAIRNTKRNWGSCSSLGNLNFNYKVALLPDCLRDYIVIHELCHLIHLHHRDSYWATVAQFCPEYEKRIIEIRTLEKETKMQPKAIAAYTDTHSCEYCTAATATVQ